MIDSSIKTFLTQLFETLGEVGFLAIILGVELLFILIFAIKTVFSYEARLKRSLNKLNKWLFTNKKIDENNIKEFNTLIKKGPKRLAYYWQQYILYREGDPSNYLTEENVIEKPLKTSSWQSNIKNLSMLTAVWAVFSAVLAFTTQLTQTFTAQIVAYCLVFPLLVLILGAIAILFIKGKRVLNLDDIYHLYHLFARFLNNACGELTPYIDFDLLFTPKEIENGNPQLREYYEERARKAKEEFEAAKKSEVKNADYNFDSLGVEGALLLNRAMKESEIYINKKTSTLSQIAQVEAQKNALRRNYDNVQMDLQRKIQASKENIQKLIEQQAATTSRIEVGLLKQQQEKETTKQASLQKDYDNEEARYKVSKDELDKEIEKLNVVLKESLDEATKGMISEYHSFFEKVMKSAYKVAEKQVDEEKKEIAKERDKNERELINVQTQIKRLADENTTLRARLQEFDSNYQQTTQNAEGHYDEEGNFIYSDGSYHDKEGFFHDVDGKVYDMNGVQGSKDINPEEQAREEAQAIVDEQVNQFGTFISNENLNSQTPQMTEQPQLDTLKAQQELFVRKPDEDYSLEKKIEDVVMGGDEADESEMPQNDIAENQMSIQDLQETQENNVGEDETQDLESVPAQNLVEEQTPKKRGRGRPRKSEQNSQVQESNNQPQTQEPKKRGRGRPRKTDEQMNVPQEKQPQNQEQKRGRGRPKKSEQVDDKEVKKSDEPVKKGRGRPRKVDTEGVTPKKEVADKTSENVTEKKRGRPRKNAENAENSLVKAPTQEQKRGRGRPRKEQSIENEDNDSLNKINDLINEQEDQFNNMKESISSQIDDALNEQNKDDLNREHDEIMKAIEELQAQAQAAREDGKSDEEISKINQRLDDLIKELSSLNSDSDNK